jgi:hypothetical protein
MTRVFDVWTNYRRDVIPVDAHAVQVEECRRAFYAGAIAYYLLMMEATTPEDEEQCERNLVTLRNELLSMPLDLALEQLSKRNPKG